MKIRQGFVSNSSSSSFVCCVCGREESGMDMDISDAGMCQCEHGHVFCSEYMNDDLYEEFKQKKIKELMDEYKDTDYTEDEAEDNFCKYWDELEYDLPSELCPCCRLEKIAKNDLIKYACYKIRVSKEELEKMFRTEFKNLGDFEKR